VSRTETSDDVYRMILNYVKVMHMYRTMVIAVRSGDSIAIEAMYVNLLPLFETARKANYIEIVCGMIETLYGTTDPKILQMIRVNRTFPLYTGRNARGELMAHKAIDDHVEGQQPGYTTLGCNPENKDTFSEASIHVTFYKKASQFAKIEYYRNDTSVRRNDCEQNEVSNNRNGSQKTNREQEHHAIAEYLKITECTIKIENRSYIRNHMWESLSKTKVIIADKSEKEVRKMLIRRGEFDIDAFAEDAYEKIGSDDKSPDLRSDNVSDEDVELPQGFYDGGEDAEGGDNDTDSVEDRNNGPDRNEVEFRLGRGKIKVRRAAVNMSAFVDVIGVGKTNLLRKNLTVVRYRAKLRESRKRKIDEIIYNKISNYTTVAVDETTETAREILNLKRMKMKHLN